MRHTVKHQPVSNFLKGTRSPYLHFVYYKTPKDLTEQLANLVKNSRGYEKFEKFNFVTSRPIKEVLLSESAKRGLSASELLRSIIEEWRSKELK